MNQSGAPLPDLILWGPNINPPTNDDFGSATPIAGASGSLASSTMAPANNLSNPHTRLTSAGTQSGTSG
jgi:hypothetical protein